MKCPECECEYENLTVKELLDLIEHLEDILLKKLKEME